MDKYFYKLQHVDGESVITHEFPADIDTEKLVYHLKDFLVACSWSEEQVENMLNLEDI